MKMRYVLNLGSCSSVAPSLIKLEGRPGCSQSEKIWKDDVGPTVPPIEKMVYLLHRKTCASFGVINLIYILQIL